MAVTLTHDCDVERRPVPLALNGDFRDTCMDQVAPDTAHDANQVHPGSFGVKDEEYEHRALLYFDLAAFIPASATIVAAVWYFHVQSQNTTGQLFRAVRCRRHDWKEDEATWNSYKSGSSWTTPGASGIGTDRDDPTTGVVDLFSTINSVGWHAKSVINNVNEAWDNQGGVCTFIFEMYTGLGAPTANINVNTKNYYAADPTLVHQLSVAYQLSGRTFQALIH